MRSGFFVTPLMSAAMLEEADFVTKRGCALYAKLRSIYHLKGLNKGCVLYTQNYGNSTSVS